jgi:hypothetical protein
MRALSTLTDRTGDFRTDPPAEPRLAHRDAARLTELISMSVIDEMLADNALAYPLFAMSRDGARLPGRAYTCARRAPRPVTRDLTGDLADLHAIRDQMARGSTLILEQLHRTCRPVASFCRRLSYELCRPVWATAYLTPANAQGFGLHYDTHGVFVLQIEGRKTWELYPPILPFPLDKQRWREDALSPEARGNLTLHARYELAPGDVLWIPRGWLHEVFTTGHASLHVSLSVPEVSRYEVVTHLLDSLAQSEEFRHDLPFDAFASAARARQESELVLKSFAAWLSGVDPADLADRTLSWLRAMWYPARCSPVTAVVRSDEEIAGAAGLAAIREAVVSLEYAPDGRLRLGTGEGEVILDPPAAGFVGSLLEADDPGPVPAGRYQDAIGADAYHVIRMLLGEGILELVADHGCRGRRAE